MKLKKKFWKMAQRYLWKIASCKNVHELLFPMQNCLSTRNLNTKSEFLLKCLFAKRRIYKIHLFAENCLQKNILLDVYLHRIRVPVHWKNTIQSSLKILKGFFLEHPVYFGVNNWLKIEPERWLKNWHHTKCRKSL